MSIIQGYKRKIYGLFSEDFYTKKAQIDLVSYNAYKIKRPYKGKANELAVYAKGVESVYAVFIGLGTCLWFATGAFATVKSASYQIPICFMINIFCNFWCDFYKVRMLYPYYEDTIRGVLMTYSFKDETSNK